MIAIRIAQATDIETLYALYRQCGKQDAGYFEQCLAGEGDVLIASWEGEDAGFCYFNRAPRYSLYRRLGVPEIQDINVTPAHRRKGIATALIQRCEEQARAQAKTMIGLGVGLTKDYGPAQILYARMGYVPDGLGITYDREAVTPYAMYRMDDDLSLMLIKTL